MAHSLAEQLQSGSGPERYAGGYSPLLLQGLSRRSVARQGAFFIPHLCPGMRLLDCGCGPGAMTIEFAKVVAPGDVVGIDIEASQLAVGLARAHQEGVANVQFAVGNIYALTFPDGAFDAVFAHAVLYHLHDPRAALAEVYRVLKPGGVVGVRDADHGGNVYSPSNPTLVQAWELIDHVLQYHGANPFMGRTQRALLRDAGFRRVEASASYDYYGTAEATQNFSAYFIEFLGQQHTEEIIAQGWADRAALEAMCAALKAWGAHPDAFFGRARCEAVGWKE